MKKKEIKKAFIWRKSIYDNNFKCNRCGAKLFDEEYGMPTGNCGFNGEDETDNRIFCVKCKNLVATMKYIPTDDSTMLQGFWSDRVDEYEKEFKAAHNYVEQLKKMATTLNKKLSEISELESKIFVLENRCKNKDAEIKKYAERLQSLTKENEALQHRLDELTELIRRGEQ